MHIIIPAILIAIIPAAACNRQSQSLNSLFPETIDGLQRVQPPIPRFIIRRNANFMESIFINFRAWDKYTIFFAGMI